MKTCLRCGKEFEPKSGSQKYCSPKCGRKVAAEKSLDWIKYRNKIKSKINPDILIAYDFRCAVCGWSLEPKGNTEKYLHSHGCEFHHITPVKDGGTNDLSNLIVLCPNCHKKAHYGYLSEQELRQCTLTKEEIERKAEEYHWKNAVEGAELLDQVF